MDKDKLFGGTDPYTLRNACFAVIDRSQDHPEVQLQAMGLALFVVCEAVGQDIRELLTACERMRNTLDGPYVSTFKAIEAYARNEIPSRRWMR